MVLALVVGALCTFSVLITLKKFEFIHGSKWRWAAQQQSEKV